MFPTLSPRAKSDNLLSFAGLAIIVLSILLIDETFPYPSYWAMLPCLGTVLILLFAREGTFAHRILCLRPMVVVGLISYSAYLWHQPIFAFTRILSASPPSTGLMAGLSLVSLGIAYLSWRYVEQPFRNKRVFSRKKIFTLSAVACSALGVLGLGLFAASGLPNRAPGMGLDDGNYIAYNERVFKYKKDQFGDKSRLNLLVLGNSTGRDLVNLLSESHKFDKFEIVYRDDISLFNDKPLSGTSRNLLKQADAIVEAAGWQWTHARQTPDLHSEVLRGKPVVLVGPKHFGYNLNTYLHVPFEDRSSVRAMLLPGTPYADREFSKLVPRENYVDLLDIFDSHFGGVPVFDEHGRILSADRVHLTKYGAIFFSRVIFDDPAWGAVLSLN